MPTHWTYAAIAEELDLQQGDIISPTAELREIFERVHPHFLDPKYLAFMVLTQSCDLFVRGGKFKSRYVNLAVIRALDSVLYNLLDAAAERVSDGVYTSESKEKARLLLQRLFNQNEQSLGLFYLHDDADAGIAEPAVALLQVSIALRSREHYELIRNARVGRLAREFQSKLGWLVGNLFSRVATRDWPSDELAKQISGILDSPGSASAPTWVSKASVTAARKSGIDLGTISRAEAIAVVKKYEPKERLEQIIDEVKATVSAVVPELSAAQIEKIAYRLRNSQQVRDAVRRQ